jgi:hypothetical protein
LFAPLSRRKHHDLELRRTAPAHFGNLKTGAQSNCAVKVLPIAGAVQTAQFAELMHLMHTLELRQVLRRSSPLGEAMPGPTPRSASAMPVYRSGLINTGIN